MTQTNPENPSPSPRHALKETAPVLSDAMYNRLKWITQIFLPAVGALYFGIAQIWGLPNPGEVVGTITVVDTFLGVILGLASSQYDRSDAKYDGVINVAENEDGVKQAAMILKNYENPADVVQQDEVRFKVTHLG